MTKTVLGIFQDRPDVERAIEKLRDEGFNPKDISLVMKDREEAEDVGENTGADVAGGAVTGAATGAAVGGIAGLLAGTVLPGLGGFLIGGPIGAALGLTGAAATTVSGAATGAVAGGLIGGLMSLGLPKEQAERYESRVKEGAILLACPARGEEEPIVMRIFDECDATDVNVVTQSREEDMKDARRMRERDMADDRSSYSFGTKGGKSRSRKKMDVDE